MRLVLCKMSLVSLIVNTHCYCKIQMHSFEGCKQVLNEQAGAKVHFYHLSNTNKSMAVYSRS